MAAQLTCHQDGQRRADIRVDGAGWLYADPGRPWKTTETGTFGRRFGASKKFGFIGGGSYDWEGRGIDDFEPVPDENNGATWFDGASLREYQYFRRLRFCRKHGLSYPQRIERLRTLLYSDLKNDGDRFAYQLQDNTPGFSLLAPQNQGGLPSYDAGSQPRHPVGSVIFGGNHVFSKTWYTWEANVGRSPYGG